MELTKALSDLDTASNLRNFLDCEVKDLQHSKKALENEAKTLRASLETEKQRREVAEEQARMAKATFGEEMRALQRQNETAVKNLERKMKETVKDRDEKLTTLLREKTAVESAVSQLDTAATLQQALEKELLNLQQGKKVLEDETKMLRGSLETAKYERDKAEAKVRTAKAS